MTIADLPWRPAADWLPGRCRVPMWMTGAPAGFCGEPAFGPQLPKAVLQRTRGYFYEPPYSAGHCCPAHGGPEDGAPILFQDGTDHKGRPMWCAVMPGFENLQESPSGFSANPLEAIRLLRAAT